MTSVYSNFITLSPELADYYRKREDAFKTTRKALRHDLLALGARTLVGEYSGSGDSGMVDRTLLFKSNRIDWSRYYLCQPPSMGRMETPMELDERLSDFVYDALDGPFGGWENNDGAEGYLVWRLKSDRVVIEHTFFMTSSDTERCVI